MTPRQGASVTHRRTFCFSLFTDGNKNGDFRQVHEGKMAKQLKAFGSKMVIAFRRPVL